MSERDEKDLKERIMLVQALPEEAAVRFLSAEGSLRRSGLAARIARLYEGPYNSKAEAAE